MNRCLKHFMKPISESRQPKIDCVSEDDLNFLQALGNYIYEKRTDKLKAINNLNPALKTASRRSELFNELKNASQDNLDNHNILFINSDTSSFNEEYGGNENPFNLMADIVSGTVYGEIAEEQDIPNNSPFIPENALLYMPVVSKWLENYLAEAKHSIAVTEFLRSVKEALDMDKELQEVIANKYK